ncbi:hypothetical protein [Noviherbaspirillum galbum]|uniref:Uncharacterized protein n=1 Tax=Noviherbaspirillum galbum TaxID=2709383 RepID=A0A6B3SZC8_9BURK|nr:hypothetical protein [Noviherbaspirillum galbum]NEX63929.1 hypothetical protein [Noviherbaspirillum galbum]
MAVMAVMAASFSLACSAAMAQVREWNDPFVPRPKPPDGEEQAPTLKLRLAFDLPLKTGERNPTGKSTQGSPPVSPTMQAELRWQSADYWFAGMTFYRYVLSGRQPWNPEFTYTFGYDDWHPNTFSLVYGNYSGNRIHPAQGHPFSLFRQGNISLGYKFKLPEELDPIFKADETHDVNCSVNANATPRYLDLKTLATQRYKRTFSVGCRYSLPSNLYANATFFYFPDKNQQQPWDPDFTYGFGYFDWHPGTVTVQYNNYAGNRLPWNDRAGDGNFRRGSISISWSMNW